MVLGAERKDEAGKPMLILIAHGSRDTAWRRSLEDLTEGVRSRSGGEAIRLAFMQFTGPTLPEVVEEAWADGVVQFGHGPAGRLGQDIGLADHEIGKGVAGMESPHSRFTFRQRRQTHLHRLTRIRRRGRVFKDHNIDGLVNLSNLPGDQIEIVLIYIGTEVAVRTGEY